MARMPALNHPTCTVDGCGSHFYPRKPGPGRPHLFGETIIPTPGDLQAVVYRALHDDGRREAYMLVNVNDCWTGRLTLPARPRKAHAPAVRRAKAFVRTGAMTS